MSVLAHDPLRTLGNEHPEWTPWLRLLDAAQAEIAGGGHEAAVPALPPVSNGAPLVDGAVLEASRRAADRWVRALLALAAEAGASGSLENAAAAPSLDALGVLEAAIAVDRHRLDALADRFSADRNAFAAVAAVAAMPLLQACARRWSPLVRPDWNHGYCPICGAWPALAEARGLERERRLRCARCAADWRTEWLRCPFCGNHDHLRLGALVPEGTMETRKADTCAVCRRYVKTVTTLRAAAGIDVALQDVATVDLDLGALAHGCEPVQGLGYPVRVRVTARPRWPRLAWTR